MLDELRVKPIDGAWQTVGRDRLAGIAPLIDTVSVDAHGPVELSGSLTRDPLVEWPDLAAGTLVDYLRDGVKVWSGRIASSPRHEQLDGYSVDLSCRGLQFDLDDDQHSRAFVFANLSEWTDAREWTSTPPARFKPQGIVQVGQVIRLQWSNGSAVQTTDRAGVIFDIGEKAAQAQTATAQLALTWNDIGAGAASYNVEAYAFNDPSDILTGAAGVFSVSAGGGLTSHVFTSSGGYRYWMIAIVRTGGSGTTTSEAGVEISRAVLATSSAYVDGSGNGAVLASQVATVVAGLVPSLSTDTTGIVASTFPGADFATRALVTPREMLEQANVLEYRQYAVDANARLVYRAWPGTCDLETRGAFDDSAGSSIDNVYGRVLVEGSGVDGRPVIGQAITATAWTESLAMPTPTDAGLEPAGIGTWTSLGGTLSRSTTTPYAGAASLLVTASGTDVENDALHYFPPTAVQGRVYAVELAVRKEHASTVGKMVVRIADDGVSPSGLNPRTTDPTIASYTLGSPTTTWISVGTWYLVRIPFVMPPLRGAAYVQVLWDFHASAAIAAGASFRVDALRWLDPNSTSLDRLGVVRTLVVEPSIPLSQAVADQIAAVYAADLGRDQFQGSTVVTPGVCRRVVGGADVTPAEMLLRYGDQIRLSNARTPTTGGAGRDGRIVGVSYSPADDTATVTIDNTTTRLDAWLARLASIAQRKGVGGTI